MRIIYHKIFLLHNSPSHPENAERLSFFRQLPDSKIENGEEFLPLVHSKDYIEGVRNASAKEEWLDADTYTNKHSFKASCFAVGAAVKAAEQGEFALCRPPGHHAFKDRSSGFCLFNNIAIAARNLLEQGRRVFIIDFDLHHGNGTQDIFLGEKNVMYFSTHQSPCYPGSGLKSQANCINVPLPYGTSDDEYIGELEKHLISRLAEFNPDVIALSAGFDSYYKDRDALGPGAGFGLTEKSYAKIKEIIKPFRHFFVLEGGYRAESIRDGVGFFTK